jgi:glycerol kinase
MNPIILVVDQSTSATKAMLITIDGTLLDKESQDHEQIYPQPGWVEHNPEEIYQNLIRVVRKLLERHPDRWSDLAGFSLTNQRETVVVFERQTGIPLHNAIVWLCRRGESLCKQLIEDGKEDFVNQKTGLKIDTYFPASKISWILDHHPHIKEKLQSGEALFGTIDTYILYRLTNGRVYATDHTNASRTLLYDIQTLDWNAQLFELFGIQAAAKPEIRESCARFGETTFEGLLQTPLPIAGVMGDSQAALFAQRCFNPGEAKATFGTGSSLLLNIGHQPQFGKQGLVTAVAWVLNGQPTYAFEGITNFTGATIAWLRDKLELISSVEETEIIANSIKDTGGVYLVPAFVGLSAPYWRPDARAAIVGMIPSTGKAEVVRAALDSIAYVINDALELMSSEAGIHLQYIYADGGAVRNRYLMQFVADLSGMNVRVSELQELSAFGALLSGAMGLGLFANLEDLKNLPIHYTEFNPQMDPSVVKKLKVGWKKAVKQVLLIE